MTRIIEPSLEDHRTLRQPLTKGESIVLDFFNKSLALEWEIYVQPHLNGLRPDFVLLNPNVGIAVFEIKDWNLDAMEYYRERDNFGYEILCANDGERRFSVQNKILSGSLRTRILGDRSANADHSLVAEGYALLDAQMTYAPLWKNGKQPIQWTISVQNLTNAVWKEAQFETESRLQHELAPVTEIHFTPGTPFNLKAGMRLVF